MAWHEVRPTVGSLCCVVLLQMALWMIPGAHAQIYRWVDEHGRVHYGDTKPPKATEQSLLDKQGRVLRRPPGAVPETTADDRARSRDIARERQDRALLSTYLHEDEIDLARDRALAQDQAKRESLQAMLQQALNRLARINGEVAAHAKAGRRVPDALRQSRDETHREIVRLHDQLGRNAASMAQTKARYEAYKQRFRELKGQAGQAPSNAGGAPAVGNTVP